MDASVHPTKPHRTIVPLLTLSILLWSAIVAGSLVWNLHKTTEEFHALALNEAIAMFNKDQGFRLWGTRHGGVYVPVTEDTPPSPYLEHVPERDIVTPSGKELTLLNPAYMVRQLMEDFNDLYGTRGHITGLVLLRPENAPDEWERVALNKFIKDGATEVSEFTEIDGEPFLRLMRPMVMTKGCEKCHGHLGFKEGDIRGGVSVSVPMQEYNEGESDQNRVLYASHASVWLIGLLFIGFSGRKIRLSLKDTLAAESEVRLLNQVLEERVQERTEALTEKEHRLRMTVDQAADGIIVIDSNGLVDTFNASAQEIFGYKEDEVVGQNISKLMPEHHSHHHDEYIQNHLKTGAVHIIGKGREVQGIRKNGEIFPLHLAVSKVDLPGKTLFSAICRDLTAQKQADIELLNAKRDAETANLAKSEFLASMSHELRTPLNSIIGFSQLLHLNKAHPLDESQKRQVQQINDAGQHLLSLINDILDLSRIETQGFSLSVEAVELKTIIDNCLILIAPIAAKHDISVINNLDTSKAPYVRADFVRLKQVVMNLLSNAVKYNIENGQIIIDGEIKGADFQVNVRDTGSGIASDDLEALFEPFNRLGQEAGEIEGTGIGLSITKKIIEMMKGKIGVESELGNGTTFWFSLPICDAPEAKEIPKKQQVDITLNIPPGQHRIIYVEDNAANRELLAQTLKPYNNIELFMAETAEEGLSLIHDLAPDLVFMDINLPGISGVEAVQQLKALPQTCNIPMIAVSANVMDGDRQKALQAGFDDYISKPLDLIQFTRLMGKILSQKVLH